MAYQNKRHNNQTCFEKHQINCQRKKKYWWIWFETFWVGWGTFNDWPCLFVKCTWWWHIFQWRGAQDTWRASQHERHAQTFKSNHDHVQTSQASGIHGVCVRNCVKRAMHWRFGHTSHAMRFLIFSLLAATRLADLQPLCMDQVTHNCHSKPYY